MVCTCVLRLNKLVFIFRQLTQQFVSVEQVLQPTQYMFKDDIAVVARKDHVQFTVIHLPQVVSGLVQDSEVVCRTKHTCVVNQVAQSLQ